ncbi:hypothetical protein [Glycocaulis alkaliphilus]|nr:hypothetical protein [Glycocaulis alkaliphilus]
MSGSTQQNGRHNIGDILLCAPIRYPARFLASAIALVVLVSVVAEIVDGGAYFLVSAAILMLIAFINTSIVYVFSSAGRSLPVLFIATTGIFLLTGGLVWSVGIDGLLPGQFALVLSSVVIASVSCLVMMVLASRAVIRSRPDKQEALDGVMIFFWIAFSLIGLFLLSREARERKIV